jgi:WD repeat-containing protein 7
VGLFVFIIEFPAGDGYIRKSTFSRMAQKMTSPLFGGISDAPLDGYVTGLHLVNNERTKETFVLGGADDGSVALWNLE